MTARAISSLSSDAWKNLIDTGKIYDDATIKKTNEAQKVDSLAFKILLPTFITGTASICGVSYLSISKALQRPVHINKDFVLPLMAGILLFVTITSIVGLTYLVTNNTPDNYERKCVDISLAKEIEDVVKNAKSPKERIEAIAKAFENSTEMRDKILSTFFRVLANHDELKYYRPTNLYGGTSDTLYRTSFPVYATSQPKIAQYVDAFCEDFKKEIAKIS
ncbi:MAG: hypothetical protein JSR58_07325 [Verrucomicrobia bacterium]|nr:hypothetical protein [Verrucomicrobiota bacterium]